MSRKDREKEHQPHPDAGKRLKDLYDQMWSQASQQWDTLLRNPLFLSTMAATFEQSMNWAARVQEMVTATVKSMNLPTSADLQELRRSIEELRREVAGLSQKIESFSGPAKGQTKPKKRSRKRT